MNGRARSMHLSNCTRPIKLNRCLRTFLIILNANSKWTSCTLPQFKFAYEKSQLPVQKGDNLYESIHHITYVVWVCLCFVIFTPVVDLQWNSHELEINRVFYFKFFIFILILLFGVAEVGEHVYVIIRSQVPWHGATANLWKDKLLQRGVQI